MTGHAVLYQYLTTTGTALYTLIGTRIWFSAYPQRGSGSGEWADGTNGMVVMVNNDDTPTNGQTVNPSVEFRCHGGDRTFTAARAVAAALYSRLQNSGGAVAAGSIYKARRTSQQELTDPDTGWPFVLARYSILMEET